MQAPEVNLLSSGSDAQSASQNPLSTNLVLYLLIESSGFSLTLKIHLHQIGFLREGAGTKDHILLLTKASYSNCIAACHSGMKIACL